MPAGRKAVLRLLIDHVVVAADGDTSWLDLVMHWAGGHQTHQRLGRPVHKLAKTGDKNALEDGRAQTAT
jgi:hypothetical protein